MKKLIIILFILSPLFSISQDIEKILAEIEKNNTTLKAFKGLAEAQKLETHTGIFPENPEVGFNYLWGDPAIIGNRHDISITQTWDFPTVYGLKQKIATSQNQQLDLNYQSQRLEILTKVKFFCIQLVYLNAFNQKLTERLLHAQDIAEAYTTRFEKGETNILEKNKAALNLLNAKNELDKNTAERSAMISELAALNGGLPVSFTLMEYQTPELPANFDKWYSETENQIPVLKQTQNEIGIKEKEVQLSKAGSMPKFTTGYMSESIVGESFKGISLGISIPLWENKNTVKLAHIKQSASEKVADDARVVYYNQLKIQFEKAHRLKEILANYNKTLPAINNAGLLKKALDAGEISLIDYMLELSLYYDTTDKILETERDLNEAIVALFYFEP